MSFAGLWLCAGGCAAPMLEPALIRLEAAGARTAQHRLTSTQADVAFGYLSSVPNRALHSPPERLGELMLVGDLRLDNRSELCHALEASPHESDARVVLRAYQRWGDACAARLLGDFAFGIWNGAAHELFLVRDACGVRPLFYVHLADRIAFGSRADVLLAISGVPRDLDERAVVDYLTELPEEESRTLFAAVKRVPPACSLRLRRAGLPLLHEFFDVASVPPLQLARDADYAEALTEALRRSVARRMAPPCEYGVLLSGGLDSTTMACLGSEHQRALGRSALHSFSAVFPGIEACDEREYQRAVIAHCGTRHTEITPTSRDASGDFSALVRAFGDPAPIGLHWLSWPIAARAAQAGVSVLLTGIDGDRVVSHGGALFTELARSRQWRSLIRECVSASDYSAGRKARVLSTQLAQAFVPAAALQAWDRIDPRKQRNFESLRYLRRSVLSSSGVPERLKELSVRELHTRDAHVRSLKASDRNWDVELLDRLGAATGVEFRHPFFDRDVLSLCVSLPGEQKRHNGFSRYVLRQAMASFSPPEVHRRRAHTSLDHAFEAWMGEWSLFADRSRTAPIKPRSLSNLSNWVDVARVESAPGHGPADFLRRCVVFSKWLSYV